jgi:hypothetical protein
VAEDTSRVLEQLRSELELASYDAILMEDALANADSERTAEEALGDLLDALSYGVVTAMLARAASIRLLQSRPGPSGKLWEPGPTRSARIDDEDAVVVPLEADQATQIEVLAERLARTLSELRDADANQG